VKQLANHTRIQRNPAQVFSEVDHQVVMLNVKKEAYYCLNEVGSAIWRELEEPHSFQELINQIREVFEVEEDECRKDVEPFLIELVEAGVIELIND
jgi:DNA-directed RNA polymerase delta subunit